MTSLEVLFDRFFNKTEGIDDHIMWVGAVDKDGYGRFKVDGKVWYAHRWIYSVVVSEIDPTMEVDHKCNVRGCVNPEHLQQISHQENQWGRTGGWAQ
jgi:hypothetical protein